MVVPRHNFICDEKNKNLFLSRGKGNEEIMAKEKHDSDGVTFYEFTNLYSRLWRKFIR